MKTKLIAIALILSSLVANAQTPDTLIVNVDDYAQLCVSSMNIFRTHKKTESADILFKSFYYDYLSSKTKIESGKNVDVFHKMEDGIAKITIKERDNIADEVYIQDKKVQHIKSYPIKIHFLNHYPPYEKLTLYVKDEKYFSQLAKISLDSLRQSAEEILKKGIKDDTFKDKYSYKFIFKNDASVINKENNIINEKRANNYFSVEPMIGVFVAWSELESVGPNFGLDWGITFTEKQKQRHRVGVMTNLSVIPNFVDTVPYKWQTITQLSLYYSLKSANKMQNELRWGISYLMDDYNEYFGPFFQYNYRKIGLRVDMPFAKSTLKEIFKFESLRGGGGGIPISEDEGRYQMSFSIFYNF